VTTEHLHLAIRVQPGASRSRVGGRRGEALLVSVTARAVEGAATEAALDAVAAALGVRRRQVTLRHGDRSRDKVLTVEVAAAERARVEARAAELRDA
jgi:uncharacterized protein YggU (UPF0235/DUF167 family)